MYGLELRVEVIRELDVKHHNERTLVKGLLPLGHPLAGHLLEAAWFGNLNVRLEQQYSPIQMSERERKSA